jgi:hypothetical protein
MNYPQLTDKLFDPIISIQIHKLDNLSISQPKQAINTIQITPQSLILPNPEFAAGLPEMPIPFIIVYRLFL